MIPAPTLQPQSSRRGPEPREDRRAVYLAQAAAYLAEGLGSTVPDAYLVALIELATRALVVRAERRRAA